MPRELKKRGRRGDGKKRKVEDQEGDMKGLSSKRRKSSDGHEIKANLDALDAEGECAAKEKVFFGLLDEEEQEYFKHADSLIEANSFADPEERNIFLANVYREADGKELKIANSQSCSRLMERLIQLSTSAQLKKLFRKFNGHFIHLIQHRFASHCVEMLFIHAAPHITEELLNPPNQDSKDLAYADEPYASFETLFHYTINELDGNLAFLMTDRFASHALRILLLVLAGESLTHSSTKHLLQSKKKENVTVNCVDKAEESSDNKRAVPDSFSEALQKIIESSVAGLDTNSLRALATHPNGNPTLQLLLRLELTTFGKQKAKEEKSIMRTLFPDDPITAESESASFINGLVYDPVGSHLMETIIRCAPGKLFKNLYRTFFRERIASYARSETAGFVVCRILERLSKDDLHDAHELLMPAIPKLVETNRTTLLRTLIERCHVREIDTQGIAVQLDAAYAGTNGFDIMKMIRLQEPAELGGERSITGATNGATNGVPNGMTNGERHVGNTDVVAAMLAREVQPLKLHCNILAQAMLLIPGPLSALILDSFVALDIPALIRVAKDPITSRTLQAALKSTNASIITTRRLVQLFYGHIGDMAVDTSASYVVDCIWEGTHGLAFIRERIAEELAENEGALRDNVCGRAVWKNWKMDMYKRKRGDWVRQSKVKASNDGFQSFSELDKNKVPEKEVGGKSALQLARERHVADKAKKEKSWASRESTAAAAATTTAYTNNESATANAAG